MDITHHHVEARLADRIAGCHRPLILPDASQRTGHVHDHRRRRRLVIGGWEFQQGNKVTRDQDRTDDVCLHDIEEFFSLQCQGVIMPGLGIR